jgi:hypothetical protein
MLLIGIKKRGMEMASFNPQDGMSGAPSKKSGGSKTILIILAILGVLGLVCCGSVGGLAWFGASKLNEIASQELRRRLDESPVAAAELGTIESLSINLMKTGQYNEKNNAGGKSEQAFIVFDVKASNASGEIVCEARGQQGQASDIVSGVLVKPDGTKVELFGDEMSIDMGAEVGGETPAEPAIP